MTDGATPPHDHDPPGDRPHGPARGADDHPARSVSVPVAGELAGGGGEDTDPRDEAGGAAAPRRGRSMRPRPRRRRPGTAGDREAGTGREARAGRETVDLGDSSGVRIHAEPAATGESVVEVRSGHDSDTAVAIGIDHAADPILDHEVRRLEAGADEDNPFGRLGRPWNRRSPFRMGFSAALGVGLVYLLYRSIVIAHHQLVLVAVAAFLAIGLNPTVSRLERFGMRRGLAVGLVFLATAAFFALIGYAIVPPVVEQATKFVNAIPGYLGDLRHNRSVADFDAKYHVLEKVQNYVASGDVGSSAAEGVIGFGKALASGFFDGLTILILTLYFLSSFNSIKRTVYRLVPRSRRARAALLGDEILGQVGGYLAGAFLIALIAGTTTLVWLTILGVPYPLALALIVTIADVIPLIGATIGAVIVTAVAFFVSVPVGIATGVFYVVYQQLENYIIYPRVMKKSVDINPAAAIVGVLIGAALLGIVGALLAIPLTAAFQLLLNEVILPRQDST